MPSARASTPASRPSRPTHAASAASQIIEQGSSFIARNSTCSQSFLLQPPTKKPEEPNECSPEISGDRIGARSLLHLARRSIGGSARAGRRRVSVAAAPLCHRLGPNFLLDSGNGSDCKSSQPRRFRPPIDGLQQVEPQLIR